MLKTFGLLTLLTAMSAVTWGQTITYLTNRADQCPYAKWVNADISAAHFPSPWTIYVACDAGTWKAVLLKANVQMTDAALTSRAGHFTIINAAMYSASFSFAPYEQKTPAAVLRHEVGHITCDSPREDVANHYANKGTCR